ncbi:MAG: FAD-dependent oxidoreductase [Burkholderiaceae bacterium]
MTDVDVAIIGAGLHGCSAALNLARRGRRVVVLERDLIGRHASGVNAGGVRTLLRHEAEIPLALEAREIWHRIVDEVGNDCGYHTVGQVAVATTEAARDRLGERHARMHALGWRHEQWFDAPALRRWMPTLTDAACGGLGAPDDGAASPYHTTMAFARAARAAGVEILEGAAVSMIDQAPDGRWQLHSERGVILAGSLLNTAGAWGDRVAAMVGDSVPLRFFLPMMMITARVPRFLEPVVISADPPLSFKQTPTGGLLIGGGRPAIGGRDGEPDRIDFAGLRASADTVRRLFPDLADVPVLRAWSGTEGQFDDAIPVIGPSLHAPRVWHAFGFCGHGFQLGPIVGRLLAELIIDGRASLPLEAFALSRFAGTQSGSA